MFIRLPFLLRLIHRCLLVALALLVILPSMGVAEQLISNHAAARLGLKRAWFTQVRVDPARHKVVHWVLDKDEIIALTSAGTIQAINAETGKIQWTTEVGLGHAPAAGVAVNSKYVALVGAGRIFILDRTDGHHLWSREIGGVSSAAPALSKKYAYVVLVSGRVEGYRLDDEKALVWQYQSYGRIFQNPTATGKVVSWPTDHGFLYVGSAETPGVKYRVETQDEIVAQPTERDPYLYVGSLDGYLYCFHEMTGSEQWRYATGFAITSQPAVVDDKVYVASVNSSLHAVDALTGRGLWHVQGTKQFVAVGKRQTYSMNRYGQLLVMNSESGGVVGKISTGATNHALVNDQSDRIFIVNDHGLIQCLHEIGADEPTWHRGAGDVSNLATEGEEAPEDTAGDAEPTEDENVDDGDDESPFENAEDEDDDEGFGGFDDDDNSDPFE